MSMPLVQQHHGPSAVLPWLSNLLSLTMEIWGRWADTCWVLAHFAVGCDCSTLILGRQGLDQLDQHCP